MKKLNKKIILEELSKIDKNEFGFNKIGLFGSFSRDEQTKDSDIDILVEMDFFDIEKKYEKGGYFRYCDLHRYLEKLFGTKVDLIDRSHFNYEYKLPEVRAYKEKVKKEILESVIYV